MKMTKLKGRVIQNIPTMSKEGEVVLCLDDHDAVGVVVSSISEIKSNKYHWSGDHCLPYMLPHSNVVKLK